MLIDTLFEEMKKIIMSLEVKYKYLGEKKDSSSVRYSADRYINAMEQQDSFFSYTTFDVLAIMNSGLTLDKEIAAAYAIKPTTIPEPWRQKVLESQRRLIVDNYEEMNDYFRRLYGLPEAGQSSVYLDVSFYENYEIDFKPLHEFTDIEILLADSLGLIEEIKQYYPGLKYLDYLGPKRISPYVARKAANFQVLRSDYNGDGDLLDRFLTIYEQCREYTMRILYVNEFSTNDNYYDRFMALMTTIMAVQRTIVYVYQGVIRRDFFDIHLIQALFESYGVPFIESLPMDYQKLLAKNLDKLLHYKSTDRVIYDIAEILGFGNAKIFKYLLVKDHQFDNEGKPIFDYIEDEHGNKKPNYKTMYDIYFQTMELGESNEEFAKSDRSMRRAYNEVVADDVYWWDEDEELLNRLYETEFNHIETKYLHMNVMVKITEMMFEIVNVFRILQDKKKKTQNIRIQLPRIIPNRTISLFTHTVFMCAAVAKRNNLRGEIITAPSKTLYLMGFDFGTDLARIKQSLEENAKYVDKDRISKYISDTEIFTAKDVDKLFNNIRDLWEFLSERLKYAKTIEEYRAYERIYRSLMVTQDMENIFTKSDGTIAETYMEMLEDLDPYLASILNVASEEVLFAYLNHGIDAIQNIIKDTKYLYAITDTSQVMVEALRKLILFFKSYTVDLKEFNVIYVLDHPYLHALKIIAQMRSLEGDVTITDRYLRDMMIDYIDICKRLSKDELLHLEHEISHMEKCLAVKTIMKIVTRKIIEADVEIVSELTNLHDIHIDKESMVECEMMLDDTIHELESYMINKLSLIDRDKFLLDADITKAEHYMLWDMIHSESEMKILDDVIMTLKLEHIDSLLLIIIKDIFREKYHVEGDLSINLRQYIRDIISIDSELVSKMMLSNKDNVNDIETDILYKQIMHFKNKITDIESQVSVNTKLNIQDMTHLDIDTLLKSYLSINNKIEEILVDIQLELPLKFREKVTNEVVSIMANRLNVLDILSSSTDIVLSLQLILDNKIDEIISEIDVRSSFSIRDKNDVTVFIDSSENLSILDTYVSELEINNRSSFTLTPDIDVINGDIGRSIHVRTSDRHDKVTDVDMGVRLTPIDTVTFEELMDTDSDTLKVQDTRDIFVFLNRDLSVGLEHRVCKVSNINISDRNDNVEALQFDSSVNENSSVIEMREQIMIIRD